MPHGSNHRPVPNQNFHQPQYDAARFACAARGRKSRPVSWHPASARHLGYSTLYLPPSAAECPPNMTLASQPLNTMPSYADGSLFSYPALDPAVSNDSFATFPALQASAPMQQASLMQMDSSQGPEFDLGTSNMAPMPQTMSDNWPFDMMSMNNSVPSADVAASSYESVPSSGGLSVPSTPDFLPIQRPEPDSVADNQEPEDVLVGMGLYNTPGSQETSRQGVSGKGLKLEETFTPSSDNEDDKSVEDDDDDLPNSDLGPNEFQSSTASTPFKQPPKPPVDLLRKSFLFGDDLEPHGMPDTHQLAMGDPSCMSYGYGWI